MIKAIQSVPWRATDYPITVAELRSASRELGRLLSEEERNQLIDFLSFNPEGGDIMPGTGGIRKARWPYKDKGKSKGLRVLYFFHDLNMPLYILAVYSKGEILRLTKREEREMAQLVRVLLAEQTERMRSRLRDQGASA